MSESPIAAAQPTIEEIEILPEPAVMLSDTGPTLALFRVTGTELTALDGRLLHPDGMTTMPLIPKPYIADTHWYAEYAFAPDADTGLWRLHIGADFEQTFEVMWDRPRQRVLIEFTIDPATEIPLGSPVAVSGQVLREVGDGWRPFPFQIVSLHYLPTNGEGFELDWTESDKDGEFRKEVFPDGPGTLNVTLRTAENLVPGSHDEPIKVVVMDAGKFEFKGHSIGKAKEGGFWHHITITRDGVGFRTRIEVRYSPGYSKPRDSARGTRALIYTRNNTTAETGETERDDGVYSVRAQSLKPPRRWWRIKAIGAGYSDWKRGPA
ncbi:hypothetical protein ACIBI9_62470 [Nonomuraea sp. NPDC050451]|uniref:hypothetical protein n=1 Tax=Nonomuraea sp. NPDC050451 TaxID=3364364 RepID=UPI0037B90821